MTKIINDEDSKNYRKQLEEFQAKVNPKPSLEEQQKLKEQFLAKRSKG
jgi:hypothetical protein